MAHVVEREKAEIGIFVTLAEATRPMREEAVKLGLPGDAIICLTNSTIEGTEALMTHKKTAVILATGGTGLVRAAYSSGKVSITALTRSRADLKPAFGIP